MAVPIAAIQYKLRVMYPSYKFEIKNDVKANVFIVTIFHKGENLGSKSFIPETPMTDFWIEMREWMRTIAR